VLNLSTTDQKVSTMMVSPGGTEGRDLFIPVGDEQSADSGSPVLFPLQCNCQRCGFCCTAFARDGMFFTGAYTKGGADLEGAPEGAREGVTLHGVALCHKLFMQHIGPDLNGALSGGGDGGGGGGGKAARRGRGKPVYMELHAPAGHLAGNLPLPEGTILTVCEGSRAKWEASAAGAIC
jgi:hypothetical protein